MRRTIWIEAIFEEAVECLAPQVTVVLWCLTLTILLSACQSMGGGSGCPPLVAYPRDVQKQAAAELRTLSKGSSLATMIVDYGKTRDACRVRD